MAEISRHVHFEDSNRGVRQLLFVIRDPLIELAESIVTFAMFFLRETVLSLPPQLSAAQVRSEECAAVF